jgi:hypothetical protein
MPAEIVRDNALAASGLLVRKSWWVPASIPINRKASGTVSAGYSYPTPDKLPADAQHRRSMYSFIKRNAPHPAMATFDLPDRGLSSVRRPNVEYATTSARTSGRPRNISRPIVHSRNTSYKKRHWQGCATDVWYFVSTHQETGPMPMSWLR